MGKRTFGPSLKGGTGSSTAKPKSSEDSSSLSDFVKRLKEQERKDRPYLEEYRKRSIEIHGNFCAKCGREFSGKDLRLLTVHHKDGNHHNNPPDGSNWENLCVYCHEDEHSREILAEYLAGRPAGAGPSDASGEQENNAGPSPSASGGFHTLREALEKALKKDDS